ncbi:hypothetical protein RIF29_03333 [Crotalaria pallida]|uniref:FHA domain-containing protein n=1 Tax=Crotalaria pallida TaxID=3830 RepID=A0AAN9IZU8_CROPI
MSITGKGNAGAASNLKVGFVKLQGKKFEYFMQTYSIVLGCNDKAYTMDVDLSSLGGGIKISHHHARIFYDFKHRGFFLEVLSKYGCLVNDVLHLPGNTQVKIESQDLIQIGDVKFYFLLPTRRGSIGPRHLPNHVVGSAPVNGGPVMSYCNYHSATTGTTIASGSSSTKKGTTNYYEDGISGKMGLRNEYEGNAAGSKGKTLLTATSS